MTAQVELDLLGVAIVEPRITAATRVVGNQFSDQRLGAVWDAIAAIHGRGDDPTPALILTEVGDTRVDPSLFPELVGRGSAQNVETYAASIIDGDTRRRLSVTLSRATTALNSDTPTDEVVRLLAGGVNLDTDAESDTEGLLTLDEFVGRDLPPEEWVIPDLLAAGERVVITGGEGAGKTTAIRQMAVCAAAGVHPFTFADVPPKTVLYVDLENPERIMVRKLGDIHKAMTDRGKTIGTRMWVQRIPQGINLSETRDRVGLHNLCQAVNPDLLVIGPAYKMHDGAGDSEEPKARAVTKALDGLREEFGFALILEHHSPHGSGDGQRTVRPFGSSLWLRWPEFGFGLAKSDEAGQSFHHRVVDVKHWRGMREDRPWPRQLESGSVLPWIDAEPERTYRGAA